MELLHTFGIDWKLFLAQILNFFVLLYLMKRFAYGPILKILEDRRKKIEKGLKEADDAHKKLVEMTEKEKAVLSSAKKQAQEILAKAQEIAGQNKEEIMTIAKKQSAEILKNTEKEIEKSRKKMIQEMKQELGELISMVSEKITRVSLDKKQHHVLIDKAIDDLEKEKIEL
jgi:F-type H+-transporting ATPase subunit b